MKPQYLPGPPLAGANLAGRYVDGTVPGSAPFGEPSVDFLGVAYWTPQRLDGIRTRGIHLEDSGRPSGGCAVGDRVNCQCPAKVDINEAAPRNGGLTLAPLTLRFWTAIAVLILATTLNNIVGAPVVNTSPPRCSPPLSSPPPWRSAPTPTVREPHPSATFRCLY